MPYLPIVKAIAPNAPIGATLHDDADDREQHVRGLLDHVEDERATAAELVQGKAEQDREQQHLQDLALGKGVYHRVRDDREQELDRALHLAGARVCRDLLGIERGRIDVHSGTWLDEVDDHQADDERDRADDLEIEERQAARLADLLHVLHAGDADHDGAEDDRRDDHLYQLDEAVAEGLHRFADLRPEVAEDHADDDRRDDLRVERLVERPPGRILVHGVSWKWLTGFRRWPRWLADRRGSSNTTAEPQAAWAEPIASASAAIASNCRGGTYRRTGRLPGRGCRYWPTVSISTPCSPRSRITSKASPSVPPSPSLRPDLVGTSGPRRPNRCSRRSECR
jgi:hypothetical protein